MIKNTSLVTALVGGERLRCNYCGAEHSSQAEAVATHAATITTRQWIPVVCRHEDGHDELIGYIYGTAPVGKLELLEPEVRRG